MHNLIRLDKSSFLKEKRFLQEKCKQDLDTLLSYYTYIILITFLLFSISLSIVLFKVACEFYMFYETQLSGWLYHYVKSGEYVLKLFNLFKPAAYVDN